MTCEKCPAAIREPRIKRPCKAGIYPYHLNKNGKLGCCCNARQIENYMCKDTATEGKRP